MDFDELVRLLNAASERERLVEKAIAEFDRWLEWRGGTIGSASRSDLEVSLSDLSIVFHTGDPPFRHPHIITRLSFQVNEYDDAAPGPFQITGGTYTLLSNLNGEAFEERITLDGQLPFESLGRGAWEFSPAHHQCFCHLPRSERPSGNDDIPY